MWNPRLDEAQAVIRIAGRNINNLTYADDTTFMAESEEELRGTQKRACWWREKRKVKNWLKTLTLKKLIMVPGPITSWQIDG